MNGVQTRFKCKLDVKRCKRFVFPPSSLLPRSNALKTKAIRYFQTDRTLTRIVSPPLYFFQLSYRRDASSRFHPDNRWGNFYSVGTAWILTKEKWLDDIKWLDLLKLKFSVGQQGNDRIDDFLYVDTYNINNSNNELSLGFSRKGNKNITWETNTNINLGIEFELLKGRLSGSIEYFNRRTTDMLNRFSVPLSLGYSGYYDNIGDMNNKGVEIDLK